LHEQDMIKVVKMKANNQFL